MVFLFFVVLYFLKRIKKKKGFFDNRHQLANGNCSENCKENHTMTHNFSTGFFYIWFYGNGKVDTMIELEKLTKLYDELELKKESWLTFAVENFKVDEQNREKFVFCFLFLGINNSYIRKQL